MTKNIVAIKNDVQRAKFLELIGKRKPEAGNRNSELLKMYMSDATSLSICFLFVRLKYFRPRDVVHSAQL